MMSATDVTTQTGQTVLELDAVVLGAGVAGLYQLHQLREQGLRVRAYDAAGDVGGTWWWNRYPGSRFDSEGYIYQYLFAEELYKDWSWSEKFPGQPEIERWLHYVDRPARPAQRHPVLAPRSPRPTSTRTAAAGPSGPTAATRSTRSSSSPAPGCSRPR